jgi:hypothetical protein
MIENLKRLVAKKFMQDEVFKRIEVLETEVKVLKETKFPNRDDQLDKINDLLEYVDDLKHGLVYLLNGGHINGSHYEVFLEAKKSEVSAYSHLAREIEHILKLAFSTLGPDDPVRNIWLKDFKRHKDMVTELINWKTNSPDKNQIKYLRDNLQDAYKKGIRLYEKAMMSPNGKDLIQNHNDIREECPFLLQELLNDDIEDLVYTVQAGF